jgi:hypothetical protein
MKPLELYLPEISLSVLDAHNSISVTSRVVEIEVRLHINVVNYYSIHLTNKIKRNKLRINYKKRTV